ncbi:uncharacterized protein C2845_PM11G19710 [Panicum miliaceum]|uniref:DUF674 domain-containing protein n=1 Tax=Panicum miliaceum TaxID=4540 RepID=A0A3L6RNY0_PANMI|nr:uncharacterized protein C2845_PM11G19710 [Panicum miliaceum]
MAATTTAVLSMKILVDTKAQRVLFAEASKDVVDFLFSLLALPVATAVKLVGKEDMAGCVGNLYASVDRLDATYVLPGEAKDAFLSPTVLSSAGSSSSSLLRLPAAPSPGQTTRSFYRCDYFYNTSCYGYVADASGRSCPSCGGTMSTVVQLLQYATTLGSGGSGSGKKAKHAAAAAAGGAVKGFVQGVAILKASLQSKTVLTDVFLGSKEPGSP